MRAPFRFNMLTHIELGRLTPQKGSNRAPKPTQQQKSEKTGFSRFMKKEAG